MEIDGKNMLDLWEVKKGAKTQHKYYFYVVTGEAVLSGDWKYHKSQTFTVTKNTRKDESPALYNLKDDIGETKNVITQHLQFAARLAKAIDEHLTRIGK